MTVSKRTRVTTMMGGAVLALVLASIPVQAQPGRAVPAIFERSIQLPGEGDEILRPSALFYDSDQKEIFVGDGGHNRIVIFDHDGVYRYEFYGLDRFALPLDLVVDSQGQILILGSTREGARLFRFDFDGLYLNDVAPDASATGRITDIAIDETDRLFALVPESAQILVFENDSFEYSLDLRIATSGVAETELIFGDMAVSGQRVYLPYVTGATVLVLDATTGNQVTSIGFRGENPGELIFPTAVSLPRPDLIAVMDKMRFAVLCFEVGGRFLGEFGGKGIRDGWFYHPDLLSPGDENRVIVGQILHNRIQVCRIPDFIIDALEEDGNSRPSESSMRLDQDPSHDHRPETAR